MKKKFDYERLSKKELSQRIRNLKANFHIILDKKGQQNILHLIKEYERYLGEEK